MVSSLYKEIILKNYRNPKNMGEPENKDKYKVSKIENPNCGDEIKVYVKLHKGIIEDVKYEIDGCAISTASASLLSEDINGTSFSDFKQKCDRKYVCDNLLNVELTPVRIKCALLIRDAIFKSTD